MTRRFARLTFRKFRYISNRRYQTTGPLHNLDGLPEIPMPIGRRPRPNPENLPPPLVLPPPAKYVDRTIPRMRQAEAEEFLYPLYLRGWRVELLRTKDKVRLLNKVNWC